MVAGGKARCGRHVRHRAAADSDALPQTFMAPQYRIVSVTVALVVELCWMYKTSTEDGPSFQLLSAKLKCSPAPVVHSEDGIRVRDIQVPGSLSPSATLHESTSLEMARLCIPTPYLICR